MHGRTARAYAVGGVTLDHANANAEPHPFFRLEPSEGNARLFHDRTSALAKAGDPHAAAAGTHTADEYERDEPYPNEDGTAGLALRDGDEPAGVSAHPDAHAGDAIAEKAVAQGARRPDCTHGTGSSR